MDKTKVVFEIGMVLAILAVFAVPATMASDNEVYLVPQSSECGPGETVTVYLMANITDGGTGGMDPTKWGGFQVNITYDASKGYIADPVKNETGNPDTWDYWDWARYGDSVWVTGAIDYPGGPLGVYKIADLTIEGIDPGTTSLAFSLEAPRKSNIFDDLGGDLPSQVWTDGTFTCSAPEETFTKPLAAGWNLISLPLTSSNNSAVKVLETVTYDAVYRYSATPSKKFESVSTMDPGMGYFVNVTATGQTWTYNGAPYTEMNVSLEPGLNMVGWLNCSKSIGESEGDALYSIKDNYNYVAMFNATSQRFEAYNPHAPSVFNDFTTMDRGTGYFISARAGCPWLNESCPP